MLPSTASLALLCTNSTLGRIIKVTQEVIDYREWIIKKWGGRHQARMESRGNAPHTHTHCLYNHNISPLVEVLDVLVTFAGRARHFTFEASYF